jgi:hypothetical protein
MCSRILSLLNRVLIGLSGTNYAPGNVQEFDLCVSGVLIGLPGKKYAFRDV